MDVLNVIQWILSTIGSAFGLAKTSIEIKKLVDENIMPDFKGTDKAEEMRDKKELAGNLLTLAIIEAAYNTARGLVAALLFGLVAHFAIKTTEIAKSKTKD